MEYDDFAVRLTGARGQWRLHGGGSAGEDDISLSRPGPSGAVSKAVARFGELAGCEGVSGQSVAPSPGDPAPRHEVDRELAALGQELFFFLLPHPIALLWHQSRARATEARRGLRLRVHVDLRRKDVAWFGSFPWELLYDEDSGGFLALDGRTPVVRYLDMRRPRRSISPAQPLRVLVVMPEPYDVTGLDLEAERDALLETWNEDERVELVFPEEATFDGVREAMRAAPIHAVHFMGHGTYDEKAGLGGLVLEAPSGRAAPVVGKSLGRLVSGLEAQPVFAVLNGCDTGRSGAGGGPWPFGYAATALMDAGLPASVAMQLPVGDDAARRFSAVLYRGLQGGLCVEQAVAEARLSLSEEFPGPAWAVPALFMRVSHGRLFAPDGASLDDRDPGDHPGAGAEDVVDVKTEGNRLRNVSAEFVGRDEEGKATGKDIRRKTTVEANRIDAEGGTVSVVGVRRRK
ncbi:MAG: CHAT domain-containing protein [Thermoanaerobaculia bacterium]